MTSVVVAYFSDKLDVTLETTKAEGIYTTRHNNNNMGNNVQDHDHPTLLAFGYLSSAKSVNLYVATTSDVNVDSKRWDKRTMLQG